MPHHEYLLHQSSNVADLQNRFMKTGATHLLLSDSGMKRLEDWGWGRWSDSENVRFGEMLQRLGEPLYQDQGWRLFRLSLSE